MSLRRDNQEWRRREIEEEKIGLGLYENCYGQREETKNKHQHSYQDISALPQSPLTVSFPILVVNLIWKQQILQKAEVLSLSSRGIAAELCSVLPTTTTTLRLLLQYVNMNK